MKNYQLLSTTKSKLSEYNLEEIRGWVIDRLYQIESKIDNIITEHFKPEKKGDFKKIILNSSIISFGGKLKILRNIPSFDKKIIDKIQKLSAIRNAFAHLPTKEYFEIKVSEKENGELETTHFDVITQMEIMNSSGELKVRKVVELIDEFYNLNKEIREYLSSHNHS